MKLHLPTGLRVALMAVLACISYTQADITLKRGGGIPSSWDGVFVDTTIEESVDIIVSGESEVRIVAQNTLLPVMQIVGDVSITMHGGTVTLEIARNLKSYLGKDDHEVNILMYDGYFDAQGGYIGDRGNVNITMHGGVFNNSASIGNSDRNTSGNTTITLYEGAQFLSHSETVGGDGVRNTTTLNVAGGYFEKTGGGIGGANVKVNVSDGGLVSLYRLEVGSGSNVSVVVADATSRMELLGDSELGVYGGDIDIVVKGGSFVMLPREGEKTYGNIGDTADSVNISVTDGGSFTAYGYVGMYALEVTVEVDGAGSTYVHKNGSLGSTDGPLSIAITNGASFIQESGQVVVAGTITVGSGSTYVMKNGSFMTNSNLSNFDLQSGGVFDLYTQLASGAWRSFVLEGTLNLYGDASFALPSAISGSGTIVINDQSSANLANGADADSLHILMRGGSLKEAAAFAGHVDVFTARGMTSHLNMGGLRADCIDSIRTNEAISLTQLAEGSTLTFKGADNYMTLGKGNAWTGENTTETSLIQFEGGSGNVQFEADARLTLIFNASDVLSMDGDTLHLCFTNGSLSGMTEEQLRQYFKLGAGWGAQVESIVRAENGELLISISTDKSNVWQSSTNDGDMSQTGDKGSIGDFGKVVVDEDANLHLDDGEDATLRQMEGRGTLHVDGAADSTVYIENGGDAFDADNEEGSTSFKGDIDITGGTTLDKTGSEEFVMEGNLTSDGDLRVTDGTLTVGEESESSVQGRIAGLGDADAGKRGELQVNGYLEVADDSNLSDSHGAITGSGALHTDGVLTVGEDVDLHGPQIELGQNGVLDVTEAQDAAVGGLAGEGTVRGDLLVEGNAGVSDNVFSGSLEGNLTVGAGADQTLAGVHDSDDSDIVVQDGGHLTVQGSSNGYTQLKSVSNGGDAGNYGSLTFSAAEDGQAAQAGSNIYLRDDIVFWNNTSTELCFNMNSDALWNESAPSALMLTTDGTIYIEKYTSFKLSSLSKSLLRGQATDLEGVLIMQGGAVEVVEHYVAPDNGDGLALANETVPDDTPGITDLTDTVEIEQDDLFYILFESVNMYTDGTSVYLDMKARTASVFDTAAGTHNSRAGAELLWEAQQAGVLQSDAGMLPIALSLNNLLQSDPARAQRVMAAMAGSTVTSLSAAQRDALQAQLTRMRWHAAQGDVGKPAPKVEDAARSVIPTKGAAVGATGSSAAPAGVHAWVEGTYSYAKLDTQGDESGYKLDAWGGSAGVDVDVDDTLRVGLAITALYGDLEARAMDTAKGDLDSYYLSVYGRLRSGDWGHTLLLTGSLNQAKLNRTVDYATGTYSTHSSTDGYGLGALYELTYDIALDAYRTSLVQPFFGASVVHTSMDGFSEQGADGAGLNVSSQKQTTSTLALGARWLETCGSELLGRTALFELRANVAQHIGDRRSDAAVGLQANPGAAANVIGAKAGRTALQLGASLNVPVSDDTQVYMNANADLRENSSSWNVSMGVRYSF